jgi:hypothetical protein
VPDDKDKPAPEAQQGASVERGSLAADNERKRRAAARLFAVFGPTVAIRLQRVEEDATGLRESGQKIGIPERKWVKRQRFVCHDILGEPSPPALDQLWVVRRSRVDGIKLGRPSSRDLVRAEAKCRLDAGDVPASLKEFGNVLSRWLADNHPDAPPMVGRVVERNIRDLWRASGRE